MQRVTVIGIATIIVGLGLIVLIIQPGESQMPSFLHTVIENLAKILGGALGGYLALNQRITHFKNIHHKIEHD